MGKLYLGDLEITNYDAVMELSGITTANTKAIQTNATNIADNKTAIEASPGYSTAWGRGAYNVTIYFDL